MQRQTVSVERWAAIRQLREGEPPTFARLGAATKVHPRTIYEHAAVENWAKQPFQSSAKREEWAERGEAEAAPEDEGGEVPEGWHEMQPSERLQWLNDFALNKVAEIARSAEAGGGVPDKAKLDAVWSMLRTVERSETLAQERAGEKVTASDAELAARLRDIDDRIIELAEAHAGWLVAERDRQPVG
jgi:hypothetical protein